MAKLTLADITSGYAAPAKYNSNNTATETAMENTLSRDGTEPNQMNAALDMNSNLIINLAAPVNNNDAARLADVQDAISGLGAANLITISDADGHYTGGNVEAALDEVADRIDDLEVDGILPKFVRTADEITAAVTPVNFNLPEGHIERYATWVNSSTDFTTACQAVAAVARAKGALTIQFTHNRTYAVWPLGTGSTLFDLDATTGVTVEGNGALLSAGEVDSSMPFVFDLQTVSDFTVRNLGFTQTYDDLDPDNGAEFFVMRQGSVRLKFENITMVNGRIGIGTRGTGADAPRCDSITAINCHFNNVYYPQNFQNSGDNYFARGIVAIGCGRSYFPWNVRNHDVEMSSQHGGPFSDVLFKVFADPAFAYNRLENMKLVYWSDGKVIGGENSTSGATISIEYQQNTAVNTTAEISGIDITFCVDVGATPTMRKIFETQKFTHLAAADTTARAYNSSNWTLSGRVRGWANGTGVACIDLFGTSEGAVWTGDVASNINLKNLFLSGGSGQLAIAINGQPFSDTAAGIILENVQTDMQISRSNWNEQKAFDALNVSAVNFTARSSYIAYTPVWSGSTGASTLGNGTIFGRYTRRGDRVKGYVELVIGTTSVAGTGNMQLSLPLAAASGEGSQVVGSAILLDSGTQLYAGSTFIADAASNLLLVAGTQFVNGTTPFSIANGDSYRVGFDYICAP